MKSEKFNLDVKLAIKISLVFVLKYVFIQLKKLQYSKQTQIFSTQFYYMRINFSLIIEVLVVTKPVTAASIHYSDM